MCDLSHEQLEAVKKRLEELTKTRIRAKRIKAITVNPSDHHLPKMKIEVGKICKTLEAGAPAERVLAIFESTLFMVVTENRGLDRGLPYFFFRGDVRDVVEY